MPVTIYWSLKASIRFPKASLYPGWRSNLAPKISLSMALRSSSGTMPYQYAQIVKISVTWAVIKRASRTWVKSAYGAKKVDFEYIRLSQQCLGGTRLCTACSSQAPEKQVERSPRRSNPTVATELILQVDLK
ncbi:hypothetical protein MPH_09174 [Macrophomina phaseolina MS6]|uniref:Uncharacterized protein n=1 Tax=Macrophomina phaseolina (strain MS6) TaxID=1126212 RepID=K2RGH6_MACPH|nr:hypothetical protein MPH_09174 [Macrophomina phaseolina MS6]